MSQTSEDRRGAFRAAMENFLLEQLKGMRAKLGPDDPEMEKLSEQYAYTNWLTKVTRSATQVQRVTHPLRATFPAAHIKETTSLYRTSADLIQRLEVGTHCLGAELRDDVTGNAAVSADVRGEILAALRVECLGQKLCDWIKASDPDLLAALSDDQALASSFLNGFQQFIERPEAASSHALAKQLYWLTGEDPANDGDFHLLAPLYASSFAHTVFRTINEDRFSEPAKAAQKAKWERRDHDGVSREYPNLAVQKFGGTKPQNISQLNSERGGSNYLLASLPPRWKSREVQAPWYVDTVLSRFGHSDGVWAQVRELRDFLLSDPPPTMETRDRREGLIDSLIDGLVDFAQRFQVMLPAGWTHDSRCRLPEPERLWLDPGRVLADAEDDAVFCEKWHRMDWPAEVGNRFGNWLNKQMGPDLPLGDVEARQWQTELLLQQDWAQRLHELRGQLDAPRYVPTREGV